MRRRGHPVRGAISGLLLGILGAIDLSLFNVRAPDSLTVIGLPVVGFALGIVLGMWAPFGGRRVAPMPAAASLPAEQEADPWLAQEQTRSGEPDEDEFPGRDE